jgi:histidyl-tRNA synthetase
MGQKSTPKGMRDLLPDDMFVREEVIEKIRAVYRKNGFVPMETPAMENLETLRAKAGEEVDRQIFIVEKELGLRFDLTVPLARVVSETSFPRPFKRYQIGKVWRKEEPQRGRFREFWQADADIIGSASMRCEAELLTMANEILRALGFEPRILLNNRKILDALAKKLNVESKKDEIFRLLDKLDKIGRVEVRKGIEALIGKEKTKSLFDTIEIKGTNDEKLDAAKKISEEGAKELEEIIKLCDFPIEIDLTLVRGLNYYTGPIFEIKLTNDIGSVAAGGRYDNLLGVYGQPDYATGISIGVDRLVTLMQTAKRKTFTTVFVGCTKNEYYKKALDVAHELRQNEIAAEVDLNERNLKKQFDYANVLNIPYFVIVGERETKENKFTLHDMKTGKEEMLELKMIIEKLKTCK